MGDFNQYLWVKKNAEKISGSLLEIGSKFYGEKTDINYRTIFDNCDYVGIDFQQGLNVDKVIDITWDIEQIYQVLEIKEFDCIICNSVLEHVIDIEKAASNIENLMKKEATLFVSVPFVWEEHGYPNDYWRFTKNGLQKLFPAITFDISQSCYYSHEINDFFPIDGDVNQFIQNDHIYHIFSNESNVLLRKAKRLRHFIQNRHFRFEYLRRIDKNFRLFYRKCSLNLIGYK